MSDTVNLRKKCIEKYFSHLNKMQFEAVVNVNGPTLILAGAGSGKTTVIINRIVNMIKFADSYNTYVNDDFTQEQITVIQNYLNDNGDFPEFLLSNKIKPWQILAITFTNKAAGELKERIDNAVKDSESDVWASTFHSTCAKILRIHADKIGYSSDFSIYDTDDQKKLIKEIMKSFDIDEKILNWKTIANEISRAKDSLIDCEEFAKESQYDVRLKMISKIYTDYSNRLKEYNCMDFDDLIFNTVKLFKSCPEVLEYYQNRFKYIMIDEYQDANYAQFVFADMLAQKSRNICVVGDDDQSIYKFRGATVENILDFEKQYKDAKVIRLEQNYRSTQIILDAANNIINNNIKRKGKNLWTSKKGGEKIFHRVCIDERDEAKFVCDTILDDIKNGIPASQHAILYRTNAQSNTIESALTRAGINYSVYGGLKFFDRKEVKDILSYLVFINNPKNKIAFTRIINEPKRGIGAATVEKISEIADQTNLSFLEIIKSADEFALLSKACNKLKSFYELINDLIESSAELLPSQLFEKLLSALDYENYLLSQDDKGADRLGNVKELLSSIVQYESESENPSLNEFIEQTSLLTDMDKDNSDSDRVFLMTIHSAKGLEFPVVFIVGCEEGLFPSNKSVYIGQEELEEERRLAYVAVTRAKDKLYITNATQRTLFGKTEKTMPSRFINEIPNTLIKKEQANNYGFINRTNKVKFDDFTPEIKTVNYSGNAQKQNTCNVKVGNTVMHKVFGKGLVISALPMGNDVLLEIAFDTVGTKKIMNNFAKLEIL